MKLTLLLLALLLALWKRCDLTLGALTLVTSAGRGASYLFAQNHGIRMEQTEAIHAAASSEQYIQGFSLHGGAV